MVHDYLVQGTRGAERVVLELLDLLGRPPLYTLLYAPHIMGPDWHGLDIRTSFLQRLPGALRYHRQLYILMPAAIEAMRLPPCDVVLSSSSAWAKNIRPPRGALHICYCYTPARFLWHWATQYVASLQIPWLAKLLVRATLPPLRWWDRRGSRRVHLFVAISRAVQSRIRRYYNRPSVVIHPPVDTEKFTPDGRPPEDFYLVVAALNPHKRVDVAVRACTSLGRRLIVVGDGPQYGELRRMAGPTVEFAGKIGDEELVQLYRRCRAFLMPQEEDFGIAPLEAQACGRPVIAYAGGGALETVIEGRTGLFIREQTPEALAEAIQQLERAEFSAEECRRNAERFSRNRFRSRINSLLDRALEVWRRGEDVEKLAAEGGGVFDG